MRHIILIVFSMLVASLAHAQSRDNDVFFKSYEGVTKLLRAGGVEPSTLRWGPIEAQCSGLKLDKDPVPYNQCRYQKAIDLVDFDNDRNACNARAQAEYPDRLLSGAATLSITRNEKVTNIYERALSPDELRFKRMGSFDACMSNKGWRDTGSAARGRISGCSSCIDQ